MAPRIDDHMWLLCVEGDGPALCALHERCLLLVCRLAPAAGFEVDERLDLASALYLYLAENSSHRLSRYAPGGSFGGWLAWRCRGFLSHATRHRNAEVRVLGCRVAFEEAELNAADCGGGKRPGAACLGRAPSTDRRRSGRINGAGPLPDPALLPGGSPLPRRRGPQARGARDPATPRTAGGSRRSVRQTRYSSVSWLCSKNAAAAASSGRGAHRPES